MSKLLLFNWRLRILPVRREEIQDMAALTDLHDTRAWREAFEQGFEIGVKIGIQVGMMFYKKELVRKWLAKGMPAKEIADIMDIPTKEVRRLAK